MTFILPKTLSTTFVETADFLRAGFLLSIPLSAPFGVPIWGFCNFLSFEILLSILGFHNFERTLLIVYLIYRFRVRLTFHIQKNYVCLNIISIFQISKFESSKNINPRGNCVGSNADGISATLLLLEVIAVPPCKGFHDTAESMFDEASVDQTDVIFQFWSLFVKSLKSFQFLP